MLSPGPRKHAIHLRQLWLRARVAPLLSLLSDGDGQMSAESDSYVKANLLEFLEELATQVEELEVEAAYAEGDDLPDTQQRIREAFATVDQVIRGKTRWLDSGRVHGPLYSTHAPAWYLDWQRETVALKFARLWIGQLDDIVPRLKLLPSLALSNRPPAECRVYLEEAARCFVHGLARGAAVLARTALEVILRDRLSSITSNVISLERDKLSRLLELCERFGILRGAVLAHAKTVRDIGNNVAHGRTIRESDVAKALVAVRKVVEALYDGEPEPLGDWH